MQSDEFLTRLRFSRLLTEDKLRDFLDRISGEERGRIDLLSQRLVDARLLVRNGKYSNCEAATTGSYLAITG